MNTVKSFAALTAIALAGSASAAPAAAPASMPAEVSPLVLEQVAVTVQRVAAGWKRIEEVVVVAERPAHPKTPRNAVEPAEVVLTVERPSVDVAVLRADIEAVLPTLRL